MFESLGAREYPGDQAAYVSSQSIGVIPPSSRRAGSAKGPNCHASLHQRTGSRAGQTLGWAMLQYSTLAASEYRAPHWLLLYAAHRPEYDPGRHGATAVAFRQACAPSPPGTRSQHWRHSQPHCERGSSVGSRALT